MGALRPFFYADGDTIRFFLPAAGEKECKMQNAECFRTAPLKPPLCKGRCQPNRLTEGLCRNMLRFRTGLRRIRSISLRQSLSQKSI